MHSKLTSQDIFRFQISFTCMVLCMPLGVLLLFFFLSPSSFACSNETLSCPLVTAIFKAIAIIAKKTINNVISSFLHSTAYLWMWVREGEGVKGGEAPRFPPPPPPTPIASALQM